MPTVNSTYPKGGGSCSKGSFMVNGSLVFPRLNGVVGKEIKFSRLGGTSCGKSPALRVAANRV